MRDMLSLWLLSCEGLLRAFLWGAKSGKEQLPAFPEPSHRAAFACGIPNEAMTCVVGFTSRERRAAARQMVRHSFACVTYYEQSLATHKSTAFDLAIGIFVVITL